MSLVQHVASFDHYLQLVANEARLVLVDFSAIWCGPCQKLAPILDDLSQQYASDLLILKVDVDADRQQDEDHQLSSLFGIENLPTMVFIQRGQLITDPEYRIEGFNPKKLQSALAGLLGTMVRA